MGLGDSSLPHRQLRNVDQGFEFARYCSLPHRQLRKVKKIPGMEPVRSLPHRQLRNISRSAHGCRSLGESGV